MKVFVIMPFDPEFDAVYDKLIKEPLEANGHAVNRADRDVLDQSIIKNIFRSIAHADVIIADLTAQNPNVYYELAVAHTLDIDTIHIVQDIDDLAFDINSYHAIKYSTLFTDASELTDKVLAKINQRQNGDIEFSNPVIDSLRGLEKKSSITPLESDVNVTDDHENRSEFRDDEVNDDGVDAELGMLDAIVVAEKSIHEIGVIVGELVDPMNILSEKTSVHVQGLVELNSDPPPKNVNARRLRIAKSFATDLNEFSDEVSLRIPRLNEAWLGLDEGISYFLAATEISSEDEVVAIRSNIIAPTAELQVGISKNLNAFEDFINVQKTLPKLSKATNRALRISDRTIGKLCDEYQLGYSVLERIIRLANDLIERYFREDSVSGEEKEAIENTAASQ